MDSKVKPMIFIHIYKLEKHSDLAEAAEDSLLCHSVGEMGSFFDEKKSSPRPAPGDFNLRWFHGTTEAPARAYPGTFCPKVHS